jgi:death on curing protein
VTKRPGPRGPVWIDERVVLAIHGRLLSLDGGLAGVRDLPLLQSALTRPQQLHAYGDKVDLVDLAVAYTAGIIRNHPFTDGNKRTGFVIGVLFIELNGGKFTATEESAAHAVLSLAAGTLNEAEFTEWMRENVALR